MSQRVSSAADRPQARTEGCPSLTGATLHYHFLVWPLCLLFLSPSVAISCPSAECMNIYLCRLSLSTENQQSNYHRLLHSLKLVLCLARPVRSPCLSRPPYCYFSCSTLQFVNASLSRCHLVHAIGEMCSQFCLPHPLDTIATALSILAYAIVHYSHAGQCRVRHLVLVCKVISI